MISRLSRREKILLLIAFIALVAGGYYYLLYQPIVEEQEIVQTEIDGIRSQYNLAVERVEQIPELEEELAALEEERAELLEAAIREPEEILAAINHFARETGISIEGYEKDEGENGHPLAFAFAGEYLSFVNFARMIDDWDYRLVIDSFTINSNDTQLTSNMFFFFHQPDELREFIEAEGNGE